MTTAQLAGMFGLHPNTVRLYEKWGFISAAGREANGYRTFTSLHVRQIEIVRIALKAEVLQNGLRKQAITIIKTMALGSAAEALRLTDDYLNSIEKEIAFANQAITIAEQILSNAKITTGPVLYTRKQAADKLNITIDTLRNWEMNGLLTAKRKQNNYRVYDAGDMRTLTVIRQLRVANYSLSAILRMLNALQGRNNHDIGTLLNTPHEADHIISVCDRLLVSLDGVKKDAHLIRKKLSENNL